MRTDQNETSYARRSALPALVVVALSLGLACGEDPSEAWGEAEDLTHLAQVLPEGTELELVRTGPDDPAGRVSGPGRFVLDEGWSRTEQWGTWAVGDTSTLRVVLGEAGPAVLDVDCRPYQVTHADVAQRITVSVNGLSVGAEALSRGFQTYRFDVPDGALRAGVNHVRFDYAHSVSPEELGEGQDPRKLSVGFRRIALRAADGEDPAGEGGRSLFVPLPYPEGGARLELELGAAQERDWPAEIPWSWQGLDGSSIADSPLARTGDGARSRASYTARLPSGHPRGGPGCLRFEQGSGVSPPRAELDAIRAIRAAVAGPPANPGYVPAVLPDIVVVLLDAARADRFGIYGHDRPTTPNCDRLAGEGLAFANVFATASYTLCSIPTMLTGLTFVDHGVETRDDVLRDEVRTLAEYLQAAGYRTVCYSANPNNSVAQGSAQGYDEFVEIWRGATRQEWLDPERITDRAVARLNRGFGDQPLFMFLHYVPPHEPYDPGPRFDLFGDPEYRGAYSGALEVLQQINRGELEPTRADLDEIVSLYDGNLLKADHSVGRLLERLRQRPRWDDTAVLVVSDHGEAFLEHGRMGHNSTVHDEMLHVPFILRPPAGRGTHGVNTSVLASLEDMMPTLLGLAGIVPDPPVAGRDLLAAGGVPPRPVVARSAGERPDYAYRTASWKGIAGTRNPMDWRLYDLLADPGEAANVALDNLDLVNCLSALLEQRLVPGTAWTLDPAEAAPDEADLEALRALGYVQ